MPTLRWMRVPGAILFGAGIFATVLFILGVGRTKLVAPTLVETGDEEPAPAE